jgi:CDP-diacylglycerol--serine O-phosphatidyltransferase
MSKKPSESLPISRLFPNIVTIIGLCFGLFALKYAMAERWEMAVGFVVIAAFIDGMDGRLARILNASSDFGAQLDSLADFFNFGIAPALILYMWITHEVKGLGWAIALFFIISQALRLARFNVSLEEDDEHDKKVNDNFFRGIPAPCGAGLSLIPMMLSFLFADKFDTPPFEITPIIVIFYMAIIAILMVSRIPTISVKKSKVRREYASVFLSIAALLVIAFIIEPWIVLPAIGIGYLLTIPFSVISYLRIKV